MFENAIESCKLLTGKPANKVQFSTLMDKVITTQTPCGVCAKGALFLSSIRKFNHFSLAESCEINDRADESVKELFGKHNADLIEAVFEDDFTIAKVNFKDSEVDYYSDFLELWVEKYPNPDNRLEAILKNLIKNRGIFVIEQI
jgi:hypothetical protein